MVNNLNRSVADLIRGKELVELGKVAVCLKNIEQIQGKINGFLVVISESARYSAKKGFVVQHLLHVFV